jgi:predicted enzyme related to lactoylglutathione lyase
MMPESSIRGYFLWHELMTGDPAGATAFYQQVVGWGKQSWEQDPSYTVMSHKGTPMAGIMKLSPEARASKTPPSWIAYVATPDIEVTAWEAQRLGGKVRQGPTKTPSVGQWAILEDPQGATFAAHTPENTPKVGQEAGIGGFSWHELSTTDYKAAFEFYRALFGWQQTGSFDMGPQGVYLTYGLANQTFGGMMTMMGEEAKHPPSWLPYIRVPDVKETTRKAASAHATILMEPMEVPGGDWIMQARDPQGAVFAIHAKTAKSPARRPAKAKKATRKKTTPKKKKASAKRKSKPARRKKR